MQPSPRSQLQFPVKEYKLWAMQLPPVGMCLTQKVSPHTHLSSSHLSVTVDWHRHQTLERLASGTNLCDQHFCYLGIIFLLY